MSVAHVDDTAAIPPGLAAAGQLAGAQGAAGQLTGANQVSPGLLTQQAVMEDSHRAAEVMKNWLQEPNAAQGKQEGSV